MATQQSEQDIPVEVYGYKTDPLRRGYQILWNYESTFWRALVGADAWSLYEVLRSFCHRGNNICEPSINLLMAILGTKERRIITGRKTTVKGKEYRYPGLIDDLQHHELVIAEVKGEGPEMRYIFHVNLTPGLLTDEQLAQLPDLLQHKHSELVKRCEEAKQELAAKKRPAKIPRTEANSEEGGSGKLPDPPLANCQTPSGNLPDKHYPYNNTPTTDEVETQRQEENKTTTVAADKQAVVVALTEKGINQNVATRLVSRYKSVHIYEKIDYLEYLVENDPDKAKNPQGWLRRAIEEDYSAPAGYQSKEARYATATAQKQREIAQQKLVEERWQQQTAEQQQRRNEAVKQREIARQRYHTGKQEDEVWTGFILPSIKPTIDDYSFRMFLAETVLLSLQENHAVVWVADDFIKQQVESQYSLAIARRLAKYLDVPLPQISIEFVAPADLEGS